MNIFNLKRQVSGYMLMCGGGGSDGGGSSSGGGDSEGGDNGDHNKFTNQEGASENTSGSNDYTSANNSSNYQFNNGNDAYGSDSNDSSDSQMASGYQSNGGQPMYGSNNQQQESGGIQSNGDYSGYTTGSDNGNAPVAQYAKDMTDEEKTTRAIVGKLPMVGTMLSGLENFGKFIQPNGSILKRGETAGYGGSSNGGVNYLDEDGQPIHKKTTGLINGAFNNASNSAGMEMSDAIKNDQKIQQNYHSPQAATPVNAAPTNTLNGVDASMYGSGSGWGVSIAKFAKAKQGEKL